MVSIITFAILGIVVLGSIFFLPQIFAYKDASSAPTTDVSTNVESDGVLSSLPFEFPELNLESIWNWIVGIFGGIEDYLSNLIANQISTIIPGATKTLATLIMTLAVVILIFWKSEWFSQSLRTILIVVIAVILIAIVLSILGVI